MTTTTTTTTGRTAAATRTRTVRARILRDIRTATPGHVSRDLAAEHVDATHPALDRLTVRQLLAACRGVGRWYARQILSRADVGPDLALWDLTPRQRDALVRELRAPRPHEARDGGGR
ncbi:NFACT family protein [Paraconexibacter antarcticus]|uniref:NFACT family protein n=1 Tax=Paraconexibacter antarcticus TaxID=2949664 RepID=A0ABY5DMW0_9ACTN|nr:NFACT family protein [Paraconexibacter antarcticus]UTI62249.1 NFACT family protein [Paraconexibacter antarcticus]